MSKKRLREGDVKAKLKAPKVEVINDYNAFYPTADSKIEVVKLSDINTEEFFKEYVQKRKPVIIDGVVRGLDISNFQPGSIVDTLSYDKPLLVEMKHKGGFGSGTQRIKMKFDELMGKLKQGDDYYLTTQYEENDPDVEKNIEISDSEEDDEGEDGYDADTLDLNNGADFSDTDSIDMNDLHDDFDDMSEGGDDEAQESDASDSPLPSDFPNDPLFESEAIRRVKELVQKPLTNLIKTGKLPLRPKILETLAPQQINLWMGSSSSKTPKEKSINIDPKAPDLGLGRQIFGGGVSSGLHHDHSDNLYVPIKGSKRFTIFAPSDGQNLYTVGDIRKIYKTGVIDYKPNEKAPLWRPVRDDGAIVTEAYKWAKINHPKFEQIYDVKQMEQEVEDEDERLNHAVPDVGLDPPSFSKIPAAIVHLDKIKDDKLREKLTKLAQKRWPKFFNCQSLTTDLKPGQMLYLPSGWFHEVSSFGDLKSDNIHIALNYWYSPPNGDKKAYKDKYWKDDYKRTHESCLHFKAGLFEL